MDSSVSADQTRDPRIATLTREVESLEAALKAGRWVRLGLLALLVLFTLGMTWRFVSLADQLRSKQNVDLLVKTGEKQLEQRMPLVRKELQALVDQSSPVVAQAFYTAAKRDLPDYLEAVEKQREPLAESLQKTLRDRLVTAYERAGNEKISMLVEEIPEAADPKVQERVEAHFKVTFERLVDKYYIKQLGEQMETMFSTWDEFPAETHQAGDPPLPDLVIGHLLEMASAKLASGDVKPMLATDAVKREVGTKPEPTATESNESSPTNESKGETQ